ncbi:MAG: TonB-dependent receptor [Bryobacterales bacterium]|nr:TonB-dependent receptor [Bryobacterales bacterium]
MRVLPFVVLASVASAQITGELRGTLTDPSGGAIPNATVTLTSVETKLERSQLSNAAGTVAFGLLQVGNYEVRAEAPGFRAAIAQAQVRTGEVASVALTLEVGQVSETVTVSGAAAPVDVENAQVQTAITGQAIQEIPVGRNVNLMALTAPGVAPVSANNPFLGSGSFNVNGGRGRGNNIVVDGITATDVSVTGTSGLLGPLNFSAIKEVKVITNNFNAEYGRNSSSQVLYITKNGTNDLHGELYEYLQNDKFNARPFFDTTGKASVSRVNTFGWELGGPVLLPKLFNGKNKAFWHTTYEGFRQRGLGATRIARVPAPGQIDAITDPAARALMNQYKIPTSATGQVQTQGPARTNADQFAVRGDFNLGSRTTLWARYSIYSSENASSGLTFLDTNIPGFGATATNKPREATLAMTRVIAASVVNEFRFGFGQNPPIFAIDTPYPIGPRLTFADGTINGIGVSPALPQGRDQRTYQFSDNVSFVRGRHTFKAGGEYYYVQADSYADANIRPGFTFTNWAEFAAGRPAVYVQNFGDSFRANRVKNVFAFVQDDWKVTRRLTVNLGLRMEWAGGVTEANGRLSNLNLDNRQAYGAAGAGPLGLLELSSSANNANTNWGPRIGFAYSPFGDQRTVVRGGYGIAYDFIFLNPVINQRFLPPLAVAGSLSGAAAFTGGNSFAQLVAGTAAVQREWASQVGRLSTTALNWGSVNPAIARDLRNPQVQQWSLGVQREQFGVVWSASYVGTKGTYLMRARPINLIANPVRPAASLEDEAARLSEFTNAFAGLSGTATRFSNRIDPRYNTVNYVESSANSIYHSAQLEVKKRFAFGYFFNANYTLAKSIDDNSDVLGVLINDSSFQQDPRNNRNNRGPSQFDLTHRLVISHSYELPFFRTSASRLLRTVAGGWGFAGITSFRSGFPVTLLAGPRRGITDPITVLGGGTSVRPNVAGPLRFEPRPAGSAGAPFGTAVVNGQAVSTYAASLGLSQPFLGNIGNLGRNTFRLNGERNFDWTIYKNIPVAERLRFQIRAEFYNLFNNTSFQDVSRTITAADFGQYTSVAQNARWIQLGARFVF